MNMPLTDICNKAVTTTLYTAITTGFECICILWIWPFFVKKKKTQILSARNRTALHCFNQPEQFPNSGANVS